MQSDPSQALARFACQAALRAAGQGPPRSLASTRRFGPWPFRALADRRWTPRLPGYGSPRHFTEGNTGMTPYGTRTHRRCPDAGSRGASDRTLKARKGQGPKRRVLARDRGGPWPAARSAAWHAKRARACDGSDCKPRLPLLRRPAPRFPLGPLRLCGALCLISFYVPEGHLFPSKANPRTPGPAPRFCASQLPQRGSRTPRSSPMVRPLARGYSVPNSRSPASPRPGRM